MANHWENANKVKIRVTEVRGTCTANHKVGDEWIVQKFTPQGFCGSAYCSLYSTIKTLIFGGKIPWEKNGEVKVGCDDHVNTVVFALKAIKEGENDREGQT